MFPGAVRGTHVMVTEYPDTIDQAVDIVRRTAGHSCIQITGNGSRHRVETGTPGLSSAKLSGIQIYRPEDWTITVRAGTPITEITDAVSRNGQRLTFDPPTDQRIQGSRPKPTIGGAIATNTGDPGSLIPGSLQHCVLGMRFINGRGEIVDAGSRAIKNVAGINLARGLVGSWGNLALICDLTLRLISQSQREQTIANAARNSTEAVKPFCRSQRDMNDMSGAIHLPAPTASRTADRLTERIKQAFDPKNVFSSKPYLVQMAI